MIQFQMGKPDPIDEKLTTLESMTVIINREARQRKLEGIDEYDEGHLIGICCDKCQGKEFRSFGCHREQRTDAPGFFTILYMKCMSCGEMICMITQTTNFTPCFIPENPDVLYKPDWNMLAAETRQITEASLKHFDALERIAFENANRMIDWM